MLYLALGTSAVCLIVQADKGVVAIIAVLIYPTYLLVILAVWSLVGGYFEDCVSKEVE